MSKYQKLSVRKELVDMLKSCQLPKEPLSDTLSALLDPVRVFQRQQRHEQEEFLDKEGGRK